MQSLYLLLVFIFQFCFIFLHCTVYKFRSIKIKFQLIFNIQKDELCLEKKNDWVNKLFAEYFVSELKFQTFIFYFLSVINKELS